MNCKLLGAQRRGKQQPLQLLFSICIYSRNWIGYTLQIAISMKPKGKKNQFLSYLNIPKWVESDRYVSGQEVKKCNTRTVCVIFSLLPAIILIPQFITAGTKLYATGNPGENATLTCEALGGLWDQGGLQLSLLRGSGLKELAEQAINAKGSNQPSKSSKEPVDFIGRGQTPFDERIQTILPGKDPRYHLTAGVDPRNPYAAMVRLTITGEQTIVLLIFLILQFY